MIGFRMRRHQGIFSLLLAVLFFGGQVFGCCLVNHQLGRLLASAWEKRAPAAEHSCCPATHAARSEKNDCAGPQGCCIQDAGKKSPQLVSESSHLPNLDGVVIAILRTTPAASISFALPSHPLSSSGPPVYLTQLRLLI